VRRGGGVKAPFLDCTFLCLPKNTISKEMRQDIWFLLQPPNSNINGTETQQFEKDKMCGEVVQILAK
jgi:hypothetical protein